MATTTKINAMKKGISNRFEDLILSPHNYKIEEQQQDIKNVFCMEGGQGESSYINNSQSQSRNLKMMLYALEETLDKIQLPRHRPGKKPLLTAADLGCSCGHNTLLIADVIVDHMTKLCGTGSLKWYTGGAIFIVSLGRLSSTCGPTDQGYIYEVYGGMFDDSWRDLIEEGMVDGEKMDSFNAPLYAPTVEEFKEVMDADGSFKINELEIVMASPPVVDDPADRGMAGRMVANYVHALLGLLIDTHIGGVMADELFIRMQRHAEIRAEELVDEIKLRSCIFDDQDDGDAADPEFCFYFSDLPSNDFNTLFHLLPQHATAAAGDGSERRYFAAAVPGSFHDRLFPKRSIDVFTSTFSLHWLSQVPEGVADKRSAAYNKDKVFVHGASQATGAAYRRQFQSDMARFLRCRATELKAGGVMFLVCLGRPSLHACPTNQGRVQLLYGAMFEESWGDLVEEGTIGRETMGSFNVPVYAATLEEFGEAVGADGSFEINRLELVITSPLAVDDPIRDCRAVGRAVANYVRLAPRAARRRARWQGGG
uniref:Jasmonate O-methyltransferase n=1 Tax=Oryza nivara TaxID=4536 RepID=A0A0E0H755_ORYNI